MLYLIGLVGIKQYGTYENVLSTPKGNTNVRGYSE